MRITEIDDRISLRLSDTPAGRCRGCLRTCSTARDFLPTCSPALLEPCNAVHMIDRSAPGAASHVKREGAASGDLHVYLKLLSL